MEVSPFFSQLNWHWGEPQGCRIGGREAPLVSSLWQLGVDYATSEVTERLVLRCVSGWGGDRKQALGGHGAFSPGIGAEWRRA